MNKKKNSSGKWFLNFKIYRFWKNELCRYHKLIEVEGQEVDEKADSFGSSEQKEEDNKEFNFSIGEVKIPHTILSFWKNKKAL